ncbi:MAG: cellulase family glycosylhydrolase [Candidatus Competibacteraceae bacterium]|nr:cellulase family glycosylhydrolase [Candidatus Competibacteraceae bacterium]
MKIFTLSRICFSLASLVRIAILILILELAFCTIAIAQQQGRGFQLATATRHPQQITVDGSDINKWGGNMVRYPIYLTNDPNLTNWINRIKTLLTTTEPKGMIVAITFLWPDRSVPGSEIHDVNQFVSDWGALATSLKKYKNVWYDLSNEPVNLNWEEIALNAAQRIRSIDSVHPIIYANPGAIIGNVDKNYHPIPGISNQVLEVHFYDWNEMQFVNNVYYGTGDFTRKNLFSLLSKVSSTAKKYGIPGYVGEIAILNTNPSAAAFLRDATRFSSVLNLNLTIHAFRESSIWDYEQNP